VFHLPLSVYFSEVTAACVVSFRRKINYKQFEAALKMMAEKKYPGDEEGLEKLKAKILETGGPVAHGVTVYNKFTCTA